MSNEYDADLADLVQYAESGVRTQVESIVSSVMGWVVDREELHLPDAVRQEIAQEVATDLLADRQFFADRLGMLVRDQSDAT